MPDKVKISELDTTTSVTGNTFLAVDDGTYTRKITVDNYNASANTTAKGYAEQAASYASDAADSATAAENTASEVALYIDRAVELAGQAATSASEAAGSASNSHSDASAAMAAATLAGSHASAAQQSAAAVDSAALLSRSWAVGGTNSRTGEDANNSKYWAERASDAAGGGVQSFKSRTGYVNPQDGDYTAFQVDYDNTSSEIEADNVQAAIDVLHTRVDSLAGNKAPTNHASTQRTYGGATASNFGHVKLTDRYLYNDGAAADSVAASSKALHDGFNYLNDRADTIESNLSDLNDKVDGLDTSLSADILNVSNTGASHYNELKGELTANGNRMYMDYHDGRYGVNTSSSRGADTFIPFKSYYYLGNGQTFNLTSYAGYQNFTVDNFLFKAKTFGPATPAPNNGQVHTNDDTHNVEFSGGISASYDSTTGILSAAVTGYATCYSSSYAQQTGTKSIAMDVEAYLII